ncbi:MAG: hypothetical protein JNJ65_06895 [Cyclobacteriaceae bacterium]|jgi:hypothetical protein|nr:hypothetical protein [Cyclobacteriaceae bacterium]
MRRVILVLGLLAFMLTGVQAQAPYEQFESTPMLPKADKVDLFKKGLAAHNKKYHATDPYKASVWTDITGPTSGYYYWFMGPTTWAQMDARPAGGEHQLDWDKNVTPYVESYGEVSYWRMNKDVNYMPEGASAAAFTKSRGRFHTVKPGQMDRYIEQMKKVAAVNKHMKSAASFYLAVRQGASKGPHVVTYSDFTSWSWLDSNTNFQKEFDVVHGVGAYAKFIDELDLCLDRSETYDVLSELVKE